MTSTTYPNFPEPDFVDAADGKIATYKIGASRHGKPPIVLVHGWPEIAYSWKNQLQPLAQAGHQVIAIDLKGFGRSDAPKGPAFYDITHMTADLISILDSLGLPEAIFCGHDWGGAIVWPMAVLYPERVAGIIGICTPHLPTPPVPPLGVIEKRFGPKHYFVQFQEQGQVEAIFSGQEDKFFRIMFRSPPPKSDWEKLVPRIYDLPGRLTHGSVPTLEEVIVSQEIIDEYISAYQNSGFHGGCNLYRNLDQNWNIMKSLDQVVRKPSLWIGAELDLFLPPEASEKMDSLVPDLERHIVNDCGHWVMWEKPDALNALMVDWLSRRFS